MHVPKHWAYELHQFCDRFKTLPRAGGIMEQDFYEIRMMTHAANISVIYDMTLTELSEQGLREMSDKAIEAAQKLQRALFPTDFTQEDNQ